RGVVMLAGVELEAMPVEAEPGVDEVDQLAVPVEHLAGDGCDRAVAVEHGRCGRQPGGVGSGVVVQEGQMLAGGGLCAGVAPGRKAEVLLEGHHSNPGM